MLQPSGLTAPVAHGLDLRVPKVRKRLPARRLVLQKHELLFDEGVIRIV